MSMTGYVTPDLMDPTQPYRRRSRFELPTNMLDPSQQPAQPDADLLAPTQTAAGAPSAEPTVQGPTEQPPSSGPDYDREISQAYGRFRDRSAQFDQAMQGFDQLRSQAPNPHRSVIGRIAEGIVSSLSPAAGRAIWEEPYERKLGAYQSQVGAQEKQLGVLHQATQDELADVRAQQQGKRTDAYYDWMSRRPTPPGKEPDLQHLYAAAVQKAINEGRDPQQDPTVQHYADAITSTQREPTVHDETPHTVQTASGVQQWDSASKSWKRIGGLPKEVPAATNGRGAASNKQFLGIEKRKNDRLAKLEQRFRDPQSLLDPAELEPAKQQIQDDYENEIATAGGEPSHFDYGTQPAKPQAAGPAASHAQGPRSLTPDMARQYLQRAGGDKDKARKLARSDNYSF